MQGINSTQKYESFEKETLKLVDKARLGKGVVLQDGRNLVTVLEMKPIHLKLVIKYFKKPFFLKRLWYSLNPSKSSRSFNYAVKLMDLGILTPQPVAHTWEKGFLLGDTSYVSEYVEYDYTARELIHVLDMPNRLEIIKLFTAFTFKMHQNKILFKDHSPGNTLIKQVHNSYEFYLVDLNRMIFKDLSLEERLKNFSRLWLSKYMVKVIALEYSRLYNSDPELTHKLLLQYSVQFKRKKTRKKIIKRKLGL